jgi:SNF2 family DNA or RNA helicase
VELFPYQQEAVDKFLQQPLAYPSVLIGDDMGLGKTVTAIALDKAWREAELHPTNAEWLGPGRRKMTLIITLKSAITVWEDHFRDWAPGLKVVSVSDTARSEFTKQALGQEADVFICHWELLRLEPKLCFVRWLHVISDEVEKGKNRKAQVTVAWKRIKGLHLTDMSGTWADNRPEDAWSILNHLYPRVWSSYHQFYNYHIIHQQKINHQTGSTYNKVIGVHDEEKIHKQMAPFYVRRLTEEVAKDLPEKVYSYTRVPLHPQQRRAYDEMRIEMLAWVGTHEDQPLPAPIVVTKLLRLQQLSIAYGCTEKYTKMVLDKETGERRQEEALRLVLTEPSSKLDAVMERIGQMPSNQSLVVFTQSKQVLNLFAKRLKDVGESFRLLTGDVTSTTARGELVSDFQAGKYRILGGTIKSGGAGITLTRANRMIFLDRDWSPSKNRQAEKRIHRIGQTQTCFYEDLIGENTIDMGRLQQIDVKWSWLKKILGDTMNELKREQPQ